ASPADSIFTPPAASSSAPLPRSYSQLRRPPRTPVRPRERAPEEVARGARVLADHDDFAADLVLIAGLAFDDELRRRAKLQDGSCGRAVAKRLLGSLNQLRAVDRLLPKDRARHEQRRRNHHRD